MYFLFVVVFVFGRRYPQPPQISQFAQGVDIFIANPGSKFEPGLQYAIFDFSSTRVVESEWSVPNAIDTFDIDNDCTRTEISHTIFTMKQLQQYLQVDIDYDKTVGYPSFLGSEFSASADFQESFKLIVNETFKMVLSRGLCVYYHVQMKDPLFTKFNFTDEFTNAIHEIAKHPFDLKLPLAFVKDFGLFYITEGRAGSRFSSQDLFDETSWESVLKLGASVETAAKKSFVFTETGGHGMAQGDIELAKKYQSIWSMHEDWSRGCPFPVGVNDSMSQWLKCTQEQNMPTVVNYKLKFIHELVTKANFPKISNHAEVQAAVNNSYYQLCATIPNCGPPKFYPKSCKQLKESGQSADGRYTLYFKGNEKNEMKIYCSHMEGDTPPVDFIPLPQPNVAYVPYLCNGDCPGAPVSHYGIPIDPETLTILKNVRTMSNYSKIWLDYGNSYTISSPDGKCKCYAAMEYNLKGTPFAFNGTSDGSKVQPASVKFVDKYHQQVDVCDFMANFNNPNVGLTTLIYIGDV